MKRFVNGIMEDPIWQKRVPRKIPEWLQTATVFFPLPGAPPRTGRRRRPRTWSQRSRTSA